MSHQQWVIDMLCKEEILHVRTYVCMCYICQALGRQLVHASVAMYLRSIATRWRVCVADQSREFGLIAQMYSTDPSSTPTQDAIGTR